MIWPMPRLTAMLVNGDMKAKPSVLPACIAATIGAPMPIGCNCTSRDGSMPRTSMMVRMNSSVLEPGEVMPMRTPFTCLIFSSSDIVSVMPRRLIASLESTRAIG